MTSQFEPSVEDIIDEINKTVERMKKAKLTNDKRGYETALNEHDKLLKKYARILYKKREPSQVFSKRW